MQQIHEIYVYLNAPNLEKICNHFRKTATFKYLLDLNMSNLHQRHCFLYNCLYILSLFIVSFSFLSKH